LRRTHLCAARIFAPHASLRRTHHRTTTSIVRTNDVANSKSGFLFFKKCTTDGVLS
jgi:hypothetical protein